MSTDAQPTSALTPEAQRALELQPKRFWDEVTDLKSKADPAIALLINSVKLGKLVPSAYEKVSIAVNALQMAPGTAVTAGAIPVVVTAASLGGSTVAAGVALAGLGLLVYKSVKIIRKYQSEKSYNESLKAAGLPDNSTARGRDANAFLRGRWQVRDMSKQDARELAAGVYAAQNKEMPHTAWSKSQREGYFFYRDAARTSSKKELAALIRGIEDGRTEITAPLPSPESTPTISGVAGTPSSGASPIPSILAYRTTVLNAVYELEPLMQTIESLIIKLKSFAEKYNFEFHGTSTDTLSDIQKYFNIASTSAEQSGEKILEARRRAWDYANNL